MKISESCGQINGCIRNGMLYDTFDTYTSYKKVLDAMDGIEPPYCVKYLYLYGLDRPSIRLWYVEDYTTDHLGKIIKLIKQNETIKNIDDKLKRVDRIRKLFAEYFENTPYAGFYPLWFAIKTADEKTFADIRMYKDETNE